MTALSYELGLRERMYLAAENDPRVTYRRRAIRLLFRRGGFLPSWVREPVR